MSTVITGIVAGAIAFAVVVFVNRRTAARLSADEHAVNSVLRGDRVLPRDDPQAWRPIVLGKRRELVRLRILMTCAAVLWLSLALGAIALQDTGAWHWRAIVATLLGLVAALSTISIGQQVRRADALLDGRPLAATATPSAFLL